ncbi:MAG: DUF2264 domain-containing protein [Rhodoglobus sp.]
MSAAEGDWQRDQWVRYADRLLAGARAHLCAGGSQVLFPGAEGGYGRAVDGLEGFTRSLLIAGFRIAGERGVCVDEHIEFCRRGITNGVDPAAADRWVLLTEHDQAKVEAASIALILDMTRAWVWDSLDALTQERVIAYLAPVVGDDSYPKTNWLWFRIVVETFLRSVGGPWSREDIDSDLALHDSLVRADGWISDGAERSYDHYVGWALHLYPVLWARMAGASELSGGRASEDVGRLDRYLADALALVGADGSPLLQGRSLIYRFAAAAPFWAGVIAGVPSWSAGQLRHAASRIVQHFDEHDVPGDSDVLSIGWHGPWRGLAQSYSGPGSPYWAAKGLLGVSLPADHPVWSAPTAPLPVETGDSIRAIVAPAWIVSGTRSDGIVRVINHGTDHAVEGTPSADSPLYARLGYSTATFPALDEESWLNPIDQAVAILDAAGRATHRSGMRASVPFVGPDDVGVVGSTWRAHWLDATPTDHRHGHGLPGRLTHAGDLDVRSLVRGPWEVRLVRVIALASDARATGVRVGGWPLAGDDPVEDLVGDRALVRSGGLRSAVHLLAGDGTTGVERRADASPLGAVGTIPFVDLPVAVGSWSAILVTLSGSSIGDTRAAIDLADEHGDLAVTVTWPDGQRTTHRINDPRTVVATVGHQDRAQG